MRTAAVASTSAATRAVAQRPSHAGAGGAGSAGSEGSAGGNGGPASGAGAVRDRSLRRSLLRWFDAHRRDLPWRRDHDSYRVWVSEVMLQQTRIEVAGPAFERFVARFPDLGSLARAPEDAVLAAWSGLGYYRRARTLHAAARALVERGERAFPRDVTAARALPGVGEYTAAAVLSIAWGVPLAAVDGNVVRVLSRLERLGLPDGRGEPHRAIAARLLDRVRPGDWNQALMELGQSICRAGRPDCATCPVARDCRAHAAGVEALHPPRRVRRATERHDLHLLVLRDRAGRLLLERGAFPHLAGLWLPTLDRGDAAELAGDAAATKSFAHAILHHSFAVRVRTVRLPARTLDRAARSAPGAGSAGGGGGAARAVERRLFRPADLEAIGRSSLLTKALRAVQAAT